MSPQRRLFVFINIGHVLDHMFMLIFPTAVLTMASAFGKSYGEMLSLSMGGFIAFGAGSLPAGWLGDVWDRRAMMAVFFLGLGASAVLAGSVHSLTGLTLSLTGVGLFASIYHPVGTAMLVANAEELGRTIGVNGVWGNVGIAASAVLTGALTRAFGWRAAFVVPGVIAILCGVAFLALVKDSGRSAQGRQVEQRRATLPRSVLLRAFSSLVVLTVAGGLVFNAATLALPKMFNDAIASLRDSPATVGLLVSTVYLIGATSQLFVGRLVDRMPLRRAFMPLAFLQAPCLLAVGLGSGWLLPVFALILMFAVFGQVTINDAMVAKYTDERFRARAFAIRYLVSFAASALAVPLVGALHDRTGSFTLTFEVLAVLACSIALAALWFPSGAAEERAAPALPLDEPALVREP